MWGKAGDNRRGRESEKRERGIQRETWKNRKGVCVREKET